MNLPTPRSALASAAVVIGALCVSASVFTLPHASAAETVVSATAVKQQTLKQQVVKQEAVDPPIIPTQPPITPEPEPTTPAPDPDPPTTEPVPPTTDPIPPTTEPVPEAPVETVAPDPVETEPDTSDEVVPDTDDSEDSDDETPVEEQTPTPTETAAVVPAPVFTPTAAPAPAIDLPFYPPASASTARDAFPFAVAGIVAALLLLSGIAAYVFTRWRVRRLRYAPAYPRASRREMRSGIPALGTHLLTSSHALASVTLPWGDRASHLHDNEPSFALGFGPRLDQQAETVTAMPWKAAVDTKHASGTEQVASTFDLGFTPLSGGLPEASTRLQAPPHGVRAFLAGLTHRHAPSADKKSSASLEVFSHRVPEPDSSAQLTVGLPPRPPSRVQARNLDLGLPPL